MNNLSEARSALQAEIKRLNSESERLSRILAQLDSGSSAASTASSGGAAQTAALPYKGKKRGRKPGRPKKRPDPTAALEAIKAAGKDGINVMRLNAQLRHAGHPNAPREELMETGKVKITGKAGGAKYHFVG